MTSILQKNSQNIVSYDCRKKKVSDAEVIVWNGVVKQLAHDYLGFFCLFIFTVRVLSLG